MSSPAAGWFPAPDREGELRYWDGTVWTDHYHRPAGPIPGPTSTGQAAAGRSSPSIWRHLTEPDPHGKIHKLGWMCGRIVEHQDGTISWHESNSYTPSFTVRLADVRDVTLTKSGEKSYIHVTGDGGQIASCECGQSAYGAIRTWLSRRTQQPSPSSSSTSHATESAAEELMRLANLLDRGLLTHSEFEAQKQRILGN